ncbi:MAG: type I-E CRISPR-associated protein Cas6/Cse3/CasE [Desulfovibrionaceae bacterium]
MFMTKAVLDLRALLLGGGRPPQDAYDAHRALWTLFDDRADRKRDFLYRALDSAGFLVVSRREPVDRTGAWRLSVKPYEPRFRAGERVYFALRANPVRKTRDASGRQVRHDVVQDERARLRAGGEDAGSLPPRAALAQEAGAAWLLARQDALGLDIAPGTLLMEGYAVHEFRRKGRRVRFAALDLKGFAAVRDPERLLAALMNGVGPSKGFGCGLLTVMRG